MVCTYADGSPCEVDPANVESINSEKTPGWQHTAVTLKRAVDGWVFRNIREPAPVVEAMRKACKEGE